MTAVADKLLLGFFGDSVQVKNYNCNDYLPNKKYALSRRYRLHVTDHAFFHDLQQPKKIVPFCDRPNFSDNAPHGQPGGP